MHCNLYELKVYELWYIVIVVRLRIYELLKERSKKLYWLAQQAHMSYRGLWNIAQGKTKKIEFDTLDALCEALKCRLNELIVRDEDYLEKEEPDNE